MGSKDWGEEWLLAHTLLYTLKRLDMRAGTQGPLQFHQVKDEAFVVHSGRVEVDHDDGTGHLVTRSVGPGEGYHIPPRTVHRVRALVDTVMYEASTPHFDDRVNCEAEYDGDAR